MTQRRAVKEQVSSDYALHTSLGSRIGSLESSLDIALAVSKAYERQFLAGRKSWLDVMNAARDVVGTEVQLADACTSELVVSWRLHILMNGVVG